MQGKIRENDKKKKRKERKENIKKSEIYGFSEEFHACTLNCIHTTIPRKNLNHC